MFRWGFLGFEIFDGFVIVKTLVSPDNYDLYRKRQFGEGDRPQRYQSRPSLVKLFKEINSKARRDQSIYDAHMKHGYMLKEIADHLKTHYTAISKVITQRGRKVKNDVSSLTPNAACKDYIR